VELPVDALRDWLESDTFGEAWATIERHSQLLWYRRVAATRLEHEIKAALSLTDRLQPVTDGLPDAARARIRSIEAPATANP
jgi:hypothetical protein